MKPNIDHIDEIIAAIRVEEIAKFNMVDWIHEGEDGCGTTACIGGFSDLGQNLGPLSFRQEKAPATFRSLGQVAGQTVQAGGPE